MPDSQISMCNRYMWRTVSYGISATASSAMHRCTCWFLKKRYITMLNCGLRNSKFHLVKFREDVQWTGSVSKLIYSFGNCTWPFCVSLSIAWLKKNLKVVSIFHWTLWFFFLFWSRSREKTCIIRIYEKQEICLVIKQYIYKQRCLKKELSHVECQAYIRTIEQNEKYYATKSQKIKKHNKKWFPKN